MLYWNKKIQCITSVSNSVKEIAMKVHSSFVPELEGLNFDIFASISEIFSHISEKYAAPVEKSVDNCLDDVYLICNLGGTISNSFPFG